MSQWNIAAAQYAPRHNCIGEHVEHHLRFIDAAAVQQCNLLVFPELSLTGPLAGHALLPAPPDDAQLAPLLKATQSHLMTIIAGITVDTPAGRQKGLALFIPGKKKALRFAQGSGACLMPGNKRVTIVDNPNDPPVLDPLASLFTCCQAVGETRWPDAIGRFQRFAHQYSIAVLMANARGGSALWDDCGQLIVRADKGELLLTGSWDRRGWQGDIIPLR